MERDRTSSCCRDVVPVNLSGDYTDILPSLNVRLNLTDDLVLRTGGFACDFPSDADGSLAGAIDHQQSGQ